MKATKEGKLHLILVTSFLLAYTMAFAQKPVIREIDKRSGANGDLVTLHGTFNPANLAVTFGAMHGTIEFASDQLLEVTVPAGATYENIVVTDLASGLSDEVAFPFLYSFGGNQGLTAGSLEGQVDFPNAWASQHSGMYDHCMCDFDGDQRTDIATANENSNSITFLQNTTALPGLSNISFNVTSRLIGAPSIHARCGDLNGDGKPDLVIAEAGAGGRIFVFRNTSTAGVMSFSVQPVTINALPGKEQKVKRIEIADLDNDGKPEVIISNQKGSYLTVLVNQSTTAAIAFSATHLTINIDNPGTPETEAASTDALVVEDLDGDGLPEIITSQFLTQTSNIFIMKNNSLPGNISFAFNQTLSIGGTVVNLKAGDLDGDDKPEIAATQLVTSGATGTISIFRNQTASSAITFAPLVTFPTAGRPWGLDFGDIDGDGLADIVVASLQTSITILNNESTPGTLAFSSLMLPTTYVNRHIAVGDVDGDAKPDIVFTSVDDNNNGIPASRISVLRNKSCLVPTIDPAGPITICSGFPLQLKTTSSPGTTYEWRDGTTTLTSGPDAFFDVTVGGSYSVIARAEGGDCSETSNIVTVVVDPGSTTGPADPKNDGPACKGSTLTLSAEDVGATAYNWRGPAGYAGSGLTPAPVSNFQAENAGRYYVDVMVNGCIAEQASTIVEMISTPDFQITYAGSDVVCPPDSKTLKVVPYDPDFTYQWAERTSGNISGAMNETVTINTSGEYFVKASHIVNPACAAIESKEATITFTNPPVADFTAPVTACTSQVINFDNQSTGHGALTLSYEWSFGASQTSSQENPTHQYSAPGTYTVTLKTTYNGGACEVQAVKSIDILSAPSVSITTPTNDFSICAGETLELGVDGTFSSYQWSTGATSATIEVTLSGNYSVDVSNGTCLITAAVTIDSLASPEILISADPAQVNEGQSSQLTASGLETYLWEPSTTLNDATLANPVATPIETTIYAVQGTGSNGCPGIATIEVSVKGDLITNKLSPSKFISPNNGDAINNYWLVGSILDYPQCSVTIYDDKGIKVYDAKPYNNDWDGTFNGKQLPDGVYYYLIRCDGEESTPRAGSITVIR